MAASRLTLNQVNAMDMATFVATFGGIAEHAPWVAAEAARARPYATREAMIDAFASAVADAAPERQRELLLAHPELAGKTEKLTAASRREQAGAGLDRLSPEEHARLSKLNAAYRDRHGIPFIYAAKGATKDEIMSECAKRTANRREVEIRHALEQVQRIMQLRIEEHVAA